VSKEVFINYWIGQEPNPPSPTLDRMPAYVDIVPLAFVGIDEDQDGNYELGFKFLTQHFPAEQIQGWIKTVQANGTKVLFSILDSKLGTIAGDRLAPFVANVASNVAEWGVDGIDFDYEPPSESETLVPLIEALREALPAGSVFTAPIYSPWISMPVMLKGLAGAVDYVTTMDYTPYPGFDQTVSSCSQYAEIMGGWSKLVIGISCMGPATDQDWGNFTPFADVSRLAAYEPPEGGPKGGAMLYTFSYDVTTRNDGTSGTGHPDGTWTGTIHSSLP
jgi:hypothetical protein